MLVKDIGEQGLLQRLQQFCPPEMIGDDAALLTPQPGQSLVVTTDMLVQNVHFSEQTTAPEDIGWRSAAANLSDLAAMGASPLGLTLALGIPPDVAVDWVERLYQGLTECLQAYGTVLVGGDVCRSAVVSVAMTAFGQVDPAQAILRSTAKPGDAIVVTGIHGAARAGLELLLNSESGSDLTAGDRQAFIQAHQRPRPRLDVVNILRGQFPPARVAGMDSSDGLADAVLQICRASGVGARIDRDRLPLPAAFRRTTWLTPEQAVNWCLYGGEDFELVLCMERSLAEQLVKTLDASAAIVGDICAGEQVVLVEGGRQRVLSMHQSFQHF